MDATWEVWTATDSIKAASAQLETFSVVDFMVFRIRGMGEGRGSNADIVIVFSLLISVCLIFFNYARAD